jgi:hypothetical protein
VSLTEERRSALLGVKLAGAVKARTGVEPAAGGFGPLPGGATLRTPAGAFVLVQDRAERGLGAALAWSLRDGRGAGPLTVVVDVRRDGTPQPAAAALLARRAAGLAEPPAVWWIDRTAVVDAVALPVDPGPYPVPPGCEEYARRAEAAGLDVVPHRCGISIEVLGLEVGRVEVDVDGGPRFGVGVGRHDREANDELFDGAPTVEALVRTAEVVRADRRPEAMPGPASLLSRERWLRHVVCAAPGTLGLPPVAPLPEAEPAVDLRQPRPAAAGGDGVVVVCSAGVDLDLVPAAADAWLAAGRPPLVVLVVPEGSDAPVTGELAGLLAAPAEVAAVVAPWERAPG